MSDSEIILGLFALVLVVFSLVVALVVPRRDPAFPGRRLRAFILIAILLVVAMLTAVEVFGGEEEQPGEEAAATETAGGEGGGTGQTETGGGTGQTETGGGGEAQGDPAAGKEVFASAGCGSCHTLADAGTTATTGPDLDDVLKGKDAAFIHQSIVDPNAVIAEGYQPDIMPQNFGDQLSEQQQNDLVAYLQQATGG